MQQATKVYYIAQGFPGGSDSKESGDLGSIPGSGSYPGEGNGNPISILAWRIPWTEEPGGLQSMGLRRVGHDSVTFTFTGNYILYLVTYNGK